MPTEKRTRVEIVLPVRSDLSAYQTALDWLAEEFAFTRGGSTLTSNFAGLYTSSTQTEIIQDAIRILFCDFEIDSENPSLRKELIAYLERVKSFLMETLEEEEVWIVFYPLSRIVS